MFSKYVQGVCVDKSYNYSSTTLLRLYDLSTRTLYVCSKLRNLHKCGCNKSATTNTVITWNTFVIRCTAFHNFVSSKFRKQLYWKFARTSIWIEFFDQKSSIPIPFSIFYLLRYVIYGLFLLIQGCQREVKITSFDRSSFSRKVCLIQTTVPLMNHTWLMI